MIDPRHKLPICQQARLLALSRASVYYRPQPTPASDLALMRVLDRLHLEHPFAGSRMLRGFVYLTAVLDWATRRILAWRLSNSLTADACVEALEEAIHRHGLPEIMNTDQGSQFTSAAFITVLKSHGVRISMDGRGCWRDNVFVERLWKSIKYEEVYLHAYDSVSAARAGIARYAAFYNQRRPHRALDGATPDAVYFTSLPAALAA
jgi:putative transposase